MSKRAPSPNRLFPCQFQQIHCLPPLAKPQPTTQYVQDMARAIREGGDLPPRPLGSGFEGRERREWNPGRVAEPSPPGHDPTPFLNELNGEADRGGQTLGDLLTGAQHQHTRQMTTSEQDAGQGVQALPPLPRLHAQQTQQRRPGSSTTGQQPPPQPTPPTVPRSASRERPNWFSAEQNRNLDARSANATYQPAPRERLGAHILPVPQQQQQQRPSYGGSSATGRPPQPSTPLFQAGENDLLSGASHSHSGGPLSRSNSRDRQMPGSENARNTPTSSQKLPPGTTYGSLAKIQKETAQRLPRAPSRDRPAVHCMADRSGSNASRDNGRYESGRGNGNGSDRMRGSAGNSRRSTSRERTPVSGRRQYRTGGNGGRDRSRDGRNDARRVSDCREEVAMQASAKKKPFEGFSIPKSGLNSAPSGDSNSNTNPISPPPRITPSPSSASSNHSPPRGSPSLVGSPLAHLSNSALRPSPAPSQATTISSRSITGLALINAGISGGAGVGSDSVPSITQRPTPPSFNASPFANDSGAAAVHPNLMFPSSSAPQHLPFVKEELFSEVSNILGSEKITEDEWDELKRSTIGEQMAMGERIRTHHQSIQELWALISLMEEDFKQLIVALNHLCSK